MKNSKERYIVVLATVNQLYYVQDTVDEVLIFVSESYENALKRANELNSKES